MGGTFFQSLEIPSLYRVAKGGKAIESIEEKRRNLVKAMGASSQSQQV